VLHDNGDLSARGSDSFSWDYEDRMVSATVNSVTTTFAYRGDGLRDSRTVGGNTTTFTWDIAAGLPVVLDDGNQYVYGAGLVSQKQSGNWFYYLADGLGSTMAVVNASGTVQDSYTYDVYGTPTKTGSLANEFDFAGQQTDGTGLQYLRARYYDPATGTFLSREPMATKPACTLNSSAYGAGSPQRFGDPSGQVPIEGSGQGGGRSDCEGLWAKIVNTVNAIYDAAKTWYDNDYGTWDTGYGSAPGDRMTPESRAAHYQEFDRLQSALDRQFDDYLRDRLFQTKEPLPPARRRTLEEDPEQCHDASCRVFPWQKSRRRCEALPRVYVEPIRRMELALAEAP
jgi:RHS repeat-associated protein